MMKRMGPRTEPWGTPQERGSEEERLSRQETEKNLQSCWLFSGIVHGISQLLPVLLERESSRMYQTIAGHWQAARRDC